jgi:hypothetical protein
MKTSNTLIIEKHANITEQDNVAVKLYLYAGGTQNFSKNMGYSAQSYWVFGTFPSSVV